MRMIERYGEEFVQKEMLRKNKRKPSVEWLKERIEFYNKQLNG